MRGVPVAVAVAVAVLAALAAAAAASDPTAQESLKLGDGKLSAGDLNGALEAYHAACGA